MNRGARAVFVLLTAATLLWGCGGGGFSKSGSTNVTISIGSAASNAAARPLAETIPPGVASLRLTVSATATPADMTPIDNTLAITPGVTTYQLSITVPNGSRHFLLEAFDNTSAPLYRGHAVMVLTGGTASLLIEMYPDVTPPSVLSVSPAPDATGVAVSSPIIVTFSEAMDNTTVTDATFTVTASGTPVAGTVGCSGATATFTPTGNWNYSTSYTATVTTGAEDLGGNALPGDNTWSFTTGSAPVPQTPVFSPPPGTYTTAQSVTLSTPSTPGTTIRYTTDGWTTSTVYTGAIAVSATTTIQAFAEMAGAPTSSTASGTYTITLTFSQSDLAGTWDGVFFDIGRNPDWWRGTATIDGSGSVTVTSGVLSDGSFSIPAAGSRILTISSTGVVTESGSDGNATFHGQMSSNKQLVIGTEDWGTDNTVTLRVIRKRTGTVFSNADFANKTFTFHGLRSGADNTWNYGTGTTNASSVATLTSEVGPAGPRTPGSGGLISVNSVGIATASNDNTWYGLVTDDKTVMFVIDGVNNDVGFHVLTITGQTYVQSDYEGIYNWCVIRNAVTPAGNPIWVYGKSTVDAFGAGTYLSYTDSVGSAAPADYTRLLSASGVITDPADATANGQMSYNKDITVRTNTATSGRYGIVIGFRN